MYRKILECDIEMKTGCFRFYESIFQFILDHQIMKTKHYTNYAVMKLENSACDRIFHIFSILK